MGMNYNRLLDLIVEASSNADDSTGIFNELGMSEEAEYQWRKGVREKWDRQEARLKEEMRNKNLPEYAKALPKIIKDFETIKLLIPKMEKQYASEDYEAAADIAQTILDFNDDVDKQVKEIHKKIMENLRKNGSATADMDGADSINSYTSDIKDLQRSAKKQAKEMLQKCKKAEKEVKESVDEMDIDDIAVELAYEEAVEVMVEGALSNPLRKHVEKLKKIKKEKPAEYAGPEELKEFIDKYYDDIDTAADLLEKEPEDLRKNEIRSLVSSIVGMLGWCTGVGIATGASVVYGGIIMSISWIFILIYPMVQSIITYCRTCNDRKSMDELTKVRDALKKVDTSKAPKDVKNKVSDLIAKIGDAETEINAKIKAVKESTNEIVDTLTTIYESVANGEITLEDSAELVVEFVEDNPEVINMIAESVETSVLKASLEKLKKIKNTAPTQYDGPKEVKEFVDKNYDKLDDIIDQVDKARKEGYPPGKEVIAGIVALIGMLIGVTMAQSSDDKTSISGGVISLISVVVFLSAAVVCSSKIDKHNEALKDSIDQLKSLKKSLEKLEKARIPAAFKKKIASIISKIDDMEESIKSDAEEERMELERKKARDIGRIADNM